MGYQPRTGEGLRILLCGRLVYRSAVHKVVPDAIMEIVTQQGEGLGLYQGIEQLMGYA